jgi:hypothetical protein
VIHSYDNAGKLIETHEQSDDFKERWLALYSFHNFLIRGRDGRGHIEKTRFADSVRGVETVA